MPKPVGKTYDADPPVDGGNNSYITVTVSAVDTGEEQEIEAAACNNVCNGQKHYRHEDCDFSCDTRCKRGVHKCKLELQRAPNPPTASDIDAAIDKDMSKFKGSTSQGSAGIAAIEQSDQLIAQVQPKATVNYEWRCWNEKPCSESHRKAYQRKWVCKVNWDIYRIEHGPDGKEVRVQGPKGSTDGPAFYVPVQDKWSDVPRDICRCRIVTEENHQTGQLPKDTPSYAGVVVGTPPVEYPIPPALLTNIKFTVTCTDMNNVVCTATNPTDKPIDFRIQPGTCFAPEDEGAQNMVNLDPIRIHLPPMSTETLVAPFERCSDPTAGEGKIACLNLHKGMPSSAIKYNVASLGDERVAALASAGANEPIRTSTTQLRYWILMDHAPIDEINKIMIPRATGGAYLNALYDVARITKTPIGDSDYQACAEPKLLAGFSSKPATEWLCRELAARDPKGLADWINAHQSDFVSLLGADAKPYDVTHAADIASGMSRTGVPEVQMAALDFLKAIPEGSRGEVMKKGGLAGLGSALMSTDPALVSKALDVAELFKARSVVLVANSLDSSLPPALVARGHTLAHALWIAK